MNARSLGMAVTLLVVALGSALRSPGADAYWTGTPSGSGSFTNQTFWLGGTVPGANDTANFTNARLTANTTIFSTVPITNANVTVNTPAGSTRALEFTNFTWWVTNRFVISPAFPRTNQVSIGANMVLVVTNSAGTGTIQVGDSTTAGGSIGMFNLAGGTVHVDRLYVTNTGVGYTNSSLGASLTDAILNGGQLFTYRDVLLVLSNSNMASKNFKIRANWSVLGGTNTVFTYADRSISVQSNATLLVGGSGTVWRSDSMLLGDLAGSSGSLLVTGLSTYASMTSLAVGSNANKLADSGAGLFGSGSAVVSDGAILAVNRLSTGSNGMGTISINGATLQFTTNTPQIDVRTTNTFTLTSSTVSFLGVTNANFFSSQVTNITFAGNNTLRLSTATNAMLGAYTFQTNNGQAFAFLDLQGGRFQSTNLLVGSGGKITGNGVVGSFNVTNQATIAPGNSPGLLTFASNLTLTSDSVLMMEIAGTNLNLFDRLVVSGVLARAGTVHVTLLGYSPLAGDSFDLIDWGAPSGGFSLLNLPSLTGGLQWNTNQFDSQGLIMVVSAIPEPRAALALSVALTLLMFIRGRRHP